MSVGILMSSLQGFLNSIVVGRKPISTLFHKIFNKFKIQMQKRKNEILVASHGSLSDKSENFTSTTALNVSITPNLPGESSV